MAPSADAGAPSVEVSRLGSSAVGISWPASARKLAVPMPATPGLSQRTSTSLDSATPGDTGRIAAFRGGATTSCYVRRHRSRRMVGSGAGGSVARSSANPAAMSVLR
jgi:hypothetical protein